MLGSATKKRDSRRAKAASNILARDRHRNALCWDLDYTIAMRIRPRFYIGGALIALAIAYLIVSAIRSTSEYYLTVDEVSARQAELGRDPIRVAGRVEPGTISWEPNTLTLKFVIVPIPDA